VVELFPHPVSSSVSVVRMQHMEIVDCLFMVLFSFLVIHVVELVGWTGTCQSSVRRHCAALLVVPSRWRVEPLAWGDVAIDGCFA
jgi:hypothetical protein